MTVFRTQQAYSRYWEARGQLGAIMACVVDAASLSSIQLGSARDPERRAARQELARLLRMYFREVVRFLRRASRETQRISNYWLPEEAIAAIVKEDTCDAEATEAECALIQATPRPPVLVLQWVRAHLYRVGVERGLLNGATAAERQQLLSLGVERIIAKIQPHFNGAAKIAMTPMPQPYTQVGRWLVFWFVYTVPFALINSFKDVNVVATVPASMLLAFGYYGLEYLGSQLKNPFVAEFGDVQLDGRFLQAVSEDIDTLLVADNWEAVCDLDGAGQLSPAR
uniref:Bestrophin homolog n=1 Tax=Haptolina ericina TaxID=156174 RepID=A0A7S3B6P0_9EUKA|mmetsp:Transcript_50644/g.113803  ORF Transcript_50644/g.113803 Transcript_50644/m.113803 type:complete len:282 (+) Transcript_50644:555-1400(+)